MIVASDEVSGIVDMRSSSASLEFLASWPKHTWWLLCAVMFIEGMDEALLPAAMYALEHDRQMSPSTIGQMAMAQALSQAVTTPFWGYVADRYSRKKLLIRSSMVWASLTVFLAFVTNFAAMITIRCLHGAFLASLGPIAQSIVADLCHESRRGTMFGKLEVTKRFGQLLTLVVGITCGAKVLLGDLRGWQVLFVLVASLAIVIAGLIVSFMYEPARDARHRGEIQQDVCTAVRFELARVRYYMGIRSFGVIITQGIFGAVPWNALTFFPIFLIHSGQPESHSAIVIACFFVGSGSGAILGGVLGDLGAKSSRWHGRPYVAQISVISGIPLTIAMLKIASVAPVGMLSFLAFSLGACGGWCETGVTKPILTEIIEPGGRASIIAWLTAMQGSSAAFFGTPLVGFLAEKVFGYKVSTAGPMSTKSAARDEEDAQALGNALMCCTVGPWLICLFAFTFLHWTYRADVLASGIVARQTFKCKDSHAADSSDVTIEMPDARPIQLDSTSGASGNCRSLAGT